MWRPIYNRRGRTADREKATQAPGIRRCPVPLRLGGPHAPIAGEFPQHLNFLVLGDR